LAWSQRISVMQRAVQVEMRLCETSVSSAEGRIPHEVMRDPEAPPISIASAFSRRCSWPERSESLSMPDDDWRWRREGRVRRGKRGDDEGVRVQADEMAVKSVEASVTPSIFASNALRSILKRGQRW